MDIYSLKPELKEKKFTITGEQLVRLVEKGVNKSLEIFKDEIVASVCCKVFNYCKSQEDKKEKPNKQENKTTKNNNREKYEEAVSNALADLVKTLFEE